MSGRRAAEQQGDAAEVKRLRLLAQAGKRGTGNHRIGTQRPWLLPLLGVALFLVVVAIAVIGYQLADNDEPGRFIPDNPAPTQTNTSRATASLAREDRLLRTARKLQPLADSKSGDRVLYKDGVCTWVEGDRDEATISCGDKLTMQVATGALTPVELRH